MWLIKDGVPYGYGELKWQYGSWWVCNGMAGRNAPKGTGKKILRKLIAQAKKMDITDLRLGTNFDNYPALFAALSCGFELLGTDKKGYVLQLEL